MLITYDPNKKRINFTNLVVIPVIIRRYDLDIIPAAKHAYGSDIVMFNCQLVMHVREVHIKVLQLLNLDMNSNP